jgi:hypothetical protein
MGDVWTDLMQMAGDKMRNANIERHHHSICTPLYQPAAHSSTVKAPAARCLCRCTLAHGVVLSLHHLAGRALLTLYVASKAWHPLTHHVSVSVTFSVHRAG